MKNMKWKEDIFEMIFDYKLFIGTRLEIAEESGVNHRHVHDRTELLGYRYAEIKATNLKSGETLFGTVEEIADALGVAQKTVMVRRKQRGRAAGHSIDFTGRKIVEYLRKPTIVKTEFTSEYQSIKPVYVNKREPMSDYGKYLLAETFKGWGVAK